MPSHLTDADIRPTGVSSLDVLGNRHADVHAKAVAHDFALPRDVVAPIIKYANMIVLIQKRLAVIIMNTTKRNRTNRESTVQLNPKLHFNECLNNTTHTIVIDTNRVVHKYNCIKYA